MLTAATSLLHAQDDMTFKNLVRNMPDTWYATPQAQAAADSILKYQFPSGGWSKNQNWHQKPNARQWAERDSLLRAISGKEGIGSTIDNGATTLEMTFLAKHYAATGKKASRKAFIGGVEYLLHAQYENGGWPQFYPFKHHRSDGTPFYSDHITFNDNAMVNVMLVLRDIYENKAPYDALRLSDQQRQQAQAAFDRGVECILNCQIKKNGKLTVWCQQHDEHTLQPAAARAYELASFTGSHETAAILELLMSLPHPSERVITSVSAAVSWLQTHALRDVKVETFVNRDGQHDRRLVHRFGHQTWARYYDLDTEEPYVCDRDGIPQPSLEYIGYERRNGYGWYGDTPQDIIDAFPAWLENNRRQ